MFGEEDIIKRVCDLSGGEKVRLCLAKIFERKPNLLILDEPTNHLDILGKESLEEVINNFEGTVIFVSHDRYFVKKISTKILLFEERAFTKFFEFGYEDYEKYVKENELSGMKDAADDNIHTKVNLETTDKETQGKQSYKESKQKSKDDKKIKKLEEEIAKLEKKLEELNLRLQDSSIQSNFEELSLVQKEIDEKNAAIMERYDMWDKLQ